MHSTGRRKGQKWTLKKRKCLSFNSTGRFKCHIYISGPSDCFQQQYLDVDQPPHSWKLLCFPQFFYTIVDLFLFAVLRDNCSVYTCVHHVCFSVLENYLPSLSKHASVFYTYMSSAYTASFSPEFRQVICSQHIFHLRVPGEFQLTEHAQSSCWNPSERVHTQVSAEMIAHRQFNFVGHRE